MPPSAKRGSNRVVKWIKREKREPPQSVLIVGVGRGKEISTFRDHWAGVRVTGWDGMPDVGEIVRGARVHKTAIGRETGETTLWWERRHKTGATQTPNPRQTRSVTATIKTLDAEDRRLGYHSGPILLWIDVEGAELDVLLGGWEVLQKTTYINIEMRPGIGSEAIDAMLRRWGFGYGFRHSETPGKVWDSFYARGLPI